MSVGDPPSDRDERGQSYALEGVIAGAVVLAAVAVALQSAAITPQSTTATNERIEVVERTIADTTLDHAARDGSLRDAVLYWSTDKRQFVDASPEGYLPGPPSNQFGDLLDRTFYDRRVAVNVYVYFTDETGGTNRERMVYQGTPSDDAVSAGRTIVLFDDDHLVGPDSGTTLAGTNKFYAPDAAADSPVYNVVEVRLVVWRI